MAIAVLSLGVWGHHMFTVGMGRPLDTFFALATMLIAIPTGVKVLNWSATLVGGRIRMTTSMLFCIAFLIQFLCGGLTGISHAIVPMDWQTKNSYFLVAHFHFVAVGGIVFAILAGLYYWFPKMSGRMLSERLGRWTFWLMTLGFNMTFIIQHFLGLAGMPRRVYTYPDLPGWGWMNMVSTIGAVFMGAASVLLLWNVGWALWKGAPAGDNPWNAWTLEWATSSPPPKENFDRLPVIRSRRPLWDLAHPDRPDEVVGAEGKIDLTPPDKVKTGMLTFIVSESGFFVVLILAFLYYNAQPHPGPNAKELDLFKTGIFSLCLFASSATMWRAEVAQHQRQHQAMVRWLALTILLGIIFMVGQGLEYMGLFQRGIVVGTNLFGTTFFTLTGFHGFHVCLGLVMLLVMMVLTLAGDFREGKATPLVAVGWYWHFVDVIWVLVLTVAYIIPRFQ